MMGHLTTVELAARWGLAKGTLENWRIRGYGPKYIKLGKKVLYPISIVSDWESNLQSSTAETGASNCDPGVTQRKRHLAR